jgi:hypothetical protein
MRLHASEGCAQVLSIVERVESGASGFARRHCLRMRMQERKTTNAPAKGRCASSQFVPCSKAGWCEGTETRCLASYLSARPDRNVHVKTHDSYRVGGSSRDHDRSKGNVNPLSRALLSHLHPGRSGTCLRACRGHRRGPEYPGGPNHGERGCTSREIQRINQRSQGARYPDLAGEARTFEQQVQELFHGLDSQQQF